MVLTKTYMFYLLKDIFNLLKKQLHIADSLYISGWVSCPAQHSFEILKTFWNTARKSGENTLFHTALRINEKPSCQKYQETRIRVETVLLYSLIRTRQRFRGTCLQTYYPGLLYPPCFAVVQVLLSHQEKQKGKFALKKKWN